MKKQFWLSLVMLVSINSAMAQTKETTDNVYKTKDFILSTSLSYGTNCTYSGLNAIFSLPTLYLSGHMVVYDNQKITLTAGTDIGYFIYFDKEHFGNEASAFASSKIYFKTSLSGLYIYTGLSVGTSFNSDESYKPKKVVFDAAMIGIHSLFQNNIGLFFEVNPVSLVPKNDISMGYTSFKLGISYKI